MGLDWSNDDFDKAGGWKRGSCILLSTLFKVMQLAYGK